MNLPIAHEPPKKLPNVGRFRDHEPGISAATSLERYHFLVGESL